MPTINTEVKQMVLKGTLDSKNPLSTLRGNSFVWQKVFGHLEEWYKTHLEFKDNAFLKIIPRPMGWTWAFPQPTGVNINMMPIKFHDWTTLPEYCLPYLDMINCCFMREQHFERDKIVYLTIHESIVQAGKTQRRAGLHLERPGLSDGKGGEIAKCNRKSDYSLAWGLGIYMEEYPKDGIYMASNVANSCKVWPVLVDKPEDVTDRFGGAEHLREYIGEGTCMEANTMYWITDRTPHEALPVGETVYRQFFRLVVGEISVWYAKHNTPNPLGVLPKCPISYDDKFE
jgi:hypothetical protein